MNSGWTLEYFGLLILHVEEPFPHFHYEIHFSCELFQKSPSVANSFSVSGVTNPAAQSTGPPGSCFTDPLLFNPTSNYQDHSDLLTFLSCSTRGGSRPQVMSCWICLQGPAAMLDSAQAASFCTLALGCLISRGRASRTPASTAAWVCRSEPLTTFPMERSAGVWRRSRKVSHSRSYLDKASERTVQKVLPGRPAPCVSSAPPAGGRCLSSPPRQCGRCRHPRGRRRPSRRQTECPCRCGGAAGWETEESGGTKRLKVWRFSLAEL